MDLGGFVVQGSRPPSAQSTHRPRSARSNNGYHTVGYQSSVDETLFSSYHQSKVDEPVTAFKAPWEYPKPKPMGNTYTQPVIKQQSDKNHKTKQKEKPLFWSPLQGTTIHTYKKKDASQSSLSDVNQFWNSRDHFRRFKHTQTFVDESLFGSKLVEPSFEAPWGEKLKGGKSSLNIDLRRVKYPSYKRPTTALGISRSGDKDSSKAVPVWKP